MHNVFYQRIAEKKEHFLVYLEYSHIFFCLNHINWKNYYVIDHFVLFALYVFKPVRKSRLLNTNRTRPAGLPAPRWPDRNRPVSLRRPSVCWLREDSLALGDRNKTKVVVFISPYIYIERIHANYLWNRQQMTSIKAVVLNWYHSFNSRWQQITVLMSESLNHSLNRFV